MRRIEELTAKLLTEDISAGELSELDRLLREDPEAAKVFVALLDLDAALWGRKGSVELTEPVMQRVNAMLAERLSAGVMARIARLPRAPHLRPFRFRVCRWSAAFAIVAASLLLIVGGWLWWGRPSAEQGARVLNVQGVVEIVLPSGEVQVAQVGQTVPPGSTLRTSSRDSFAVIEWSDGTYSLNPETSVRLPEAGQHTLWLDQGVLHGTNTPQPNRSPVVVATSLAAVRIEGDRFHLASAAPESLRVDVEVGKAQVVRQADQKTVAVESGDAVFVQAEAEDMVVERAPYVTEPRRVLGFDGASAVTFLAEGKILAASYREIHRFGLGPDVQKLQLSTDTSHGRLAAFTPDGQTLMVYRGLVAEDPVIFWDVATRQKIQTVHAPITDRQHFALAPDASWLATADRDRSRRTLHLWNVHTGQARGAVSLPGDIGCLAGVPSGNLLAVGIHNRILLLDPTTGEEQAALPVRASPLTVLAFSPDGRFLAAGITGQVQIWNVEKRELVRTIRGFERVLLTLAFSPDGQGLAGGTLDGQVWLWNVAQGASMQVIQAGTSGVRLLAFTPDGRSVITGGIRRQPLMLWDVLKPRVERPESRRAS